ncbi:MAG: VanW family protein [Clostridia bacterium]|nr:VanW family protein [Clostridia bacterium]
MLEPAGFFVQYDPATRIRSLIIPENYFAHEIFSPYEAYLMVKEKIMEEQAKRPQKIGSFSTLFDLDYRSRAANIKLATEMIDGYKLNPGEEFSFNKVVGPRLPERGFQKAIVFVNKEKVEDYGGGVCQVSSTIYNAVLKAGLRIIERQPHSIPVDYVPKGKDATVSYGAIDFCFQNNTKDIISIRTFINKNILTVELFQEPAKQL